MNENNQKTLKDARKIIEKFGGIRPMATKLSVPVTTVQGWKKRDVIPGARLNDILKAAELNNIDLSGILSAANENSDADDNVFDVSFDRVLTAATRDSNPQQNNRHQAAVHAAKLTAEKEPSLNIPEVIMNRIKAAERRAVQKSSLVAALLIILATAFGAFLLWPSKVQTDRHGLRLSTLEGDVAEIKKSMLERLLPENLEQEFLRLQNQAQALQTRLEGFAVQAEALNGVIGPDAGPISARLERLEAVVNDLTGSGELAGLINKVQQLQQSVEGQLQLSESIKEMNAVIGSLQGRMDNVDEALNQARQQDPALGQTLEGVSSTDLKAAAMLVGLAQFRSSLDRSAPFKEDLALLQNMLGNDDPELAAAIQRLAPQAEKGVLSPAGLSAEFRGLAGDIALSSLKGEDVTLREKAEARLNDVLRIEKDGQPVTGTDTQAAIARAQKALDTGDIATAIAELQALEGPAAETAGPWLESAETTLLAQQVQQMLTGAVLSRIGSGKLSASGAGLQGLVNQLEQLGGGQRVYTDPESGFSIYPQKPKLLPNMLDKSLEQ